MSIRTEMTDRGATITLDAKTAVETLDRATAFVRGGGLMPAVAGDAVESGREVRRQLAAQVRPPADDDFGEDDDFQDSHTIEQLAGRLIADWPELRHVQETTVNYAWKRKGGKSKGALVAGKCLPLTGPAKHYGEAAFLIWLAADHCRDAAFGAEQFEALVFHQLKHVGYVADDDPDSDTYGELEIKAVGHDVEGFYDEIRRYGAWTQALRTTDQEFRQLGLSESEAA